MNLGSTELLLVMAVLVLLVGAKKLPELARGSGRALRIFRIESKGLLEYAPAPPPGLRAESLLTEEPNGC
jgi:sec-independent protein translocase protein TatA